MRVAVIGAGFAGLAAAYYLLESKQHFVTIFSKDPIGGGASGVASGLLHPYPGLSAKRSHRAEEALRCSKELIRISEKYSPSVVSMQSGILRQTINLEQYQRFQKHIDEHKDIQHIDKQLFLIDSGITVLSVNYLHGLSYAIREKGGEFIEQKIASLQDLADFDRIVIAAGYGIRDFPECAHLQVQFLKGQRLLLSGASPFERSYISKGYIAHLGKTDRFEIGSTYERNFTDDTPKQEFAKELLSDKLALCPNAQVIDCKAAVRVCAKGHYAPIIEKVAENAYVFTALGSRGLLYHALYGKILADALTRE